MNSPVALQKRSVSSADGVKLEYDVIGSGEPLVMLHGIFAGRAIFSRQHELADRWRLIVPSMRAHDGTDGRMPPAYGIATIELDDLLAVLDTEGLKRFHLLGHSSGGALAFEFARRFPEQVDRLILIEPTLLNLLRPEENAAAREFSAIADVGERHGDREGMASAMAWLGGDGWKALDEAKKTARLDAMTPVQHLLVPHMRALVNFAITEDEVRGLRIPTLLIYGGASYPVEFQLAARLKEIRPDWPQVLVEGAGHNCYRDQPKVVNAAIRTFLMA